MKKLLITLTLALFTLTGTPVLATTTKAPAKVTVAKKASVKKTVAKKTASKKTTSKYGTSKNPVFSPDAAALAMGGVPGGEAYQAALRQAEKDCIAAGRDPVKLAACDQEFKDAQLLLGQ